MKQFFFFTITRYPWRKWKSHVYTSKYLQNLFLLKIYLFTYSHKHEGKPIQQKIYSASSNTVSVSRFFPFCYWIYLLSNSWKKKYIKSNRHQFSHIFFYLNQHQTILLPIWFLHKLTHSLIMYSGFRITQQFIMKQIYGFNTPDVHYMVWFLCIHFDNTILYL